MQLRRWLRALCLGLALCAGAVLARSIDFELQSPQGAVTQKSYAGKYLLLAIGFTSCPDICPTTLYDIGKAMQMLENPDAVQPLFVTIDPLHDDVARLNAYTTHFHPRIIGLSGEMANIEALAKQLGASFGYRLNGKRVREPQPGTPYTVYHSTLVYLISPQGELLDAFDYQIGGKGLAETLGKVLGQTPVPSQAAAAPPSPAFDGKCALPKGFRKSDKDLALEDVVTGGDTGKPALVNLWALWCKPCREELPLLDALAAAQQNMAVHVLNLGDEEADIAALFAELGITHLAQSRGEGDLLERFGAVGLPFTALFVRGKLLGVKTGVIDETDSLTAFAQCSIQP